MTYGEQAERPDGLKFHLISSDSIGATTVIILWEIEIENNSGGIDQRNAAPVAKKPKVNIKENA